MEDRRRFYIDGQWVDPAEPRDCEVIDPATEEPVGTISLGGARDVDRAVAAARRAFETFSHTTREERLGLLESATAAYKQRYDDIARAISIEMGAPTSLARKAQAGAGIGHLRATAEALRAMPLDERSGTTRLVREPIGVCGLITPWNWPVNQIACKVAPALAAGCTMVLKPSEIAPLSGLLWAEVMHDAGVPAGVFNLVNGDGPTAGQALAAHADVDMVSFTGSTRAGVLVAKAAADGVKRVAQELGGKSANLLLDDADLESFVRRGTRDCFTNSGQSCDAPTRMLVPAARHDEAAEIAARVARETVVGDPRAEDTTIGPVVSLAQYDKIQGLIRRGVEEGAQLIAGGPGRPAGLERGYYVQPTVFAGVSNEMSIAREEIFGPVLSILPYDDEEQAIRMANDSPYGLAAYVASGDLERARRVASRLRAGQVHVNGAPHDIQAPFGGFKQSGNGREWGAFGIGEFLEVKALLGWGE